MFSEVIILELNKIKMDLEILCTYFEALWVPYTFEKYEGVARHCKFSARKV